MLDRCRLVRQANPWTCSGAAGRIEWHRWLVCFFGVRRFIATLLRSPKAAINRRTPKLRDSQPSFLLAEDLVMRASCRAALPLLVVGLSSLAARDSTPPGAGGPLTPEEERKSFHLTAGLRVELVACEPDVQSPVAMAFDEDGRLWVVEMPDYPNGPPRGQPPGGRVVILEDRDGSGRYRRTAVFADRLLFANGVLPWRGGAVVTAAPHILFLQDTMGGDQADRRDVLYEGFAAENPQLRVSSPALGLDGWIYVANGLRGGMVRRAGRPDAKPINLGGRDFRFDLLHDRSEAVSGMGQFGNAFDAWGRRFVCDNRHHIRHVVLEDQYLRRNPYLAVPEVVEDISELEPGPLSSGGRVFPISSNWTTSNLHAGRFTSACGVLPYRGDLLPEEYRQSVFTCEPAGNLVHQEVLQPRSATFRSRPARQGVEFLASPNDWFRPVFLADGPDGALYVVDMYRAVIEHPEFMPPELKNRPDLLLGKDKGRIWRIVPETHREKPPQPRLGKASTEALVRLLEHPGGWWRMTAHRLLLERQDRAAVVPLKKMCDQSKEPLARMHAAWVLESLGALDTDLVGRLLLDPHPRVREHAVRLAESRLRVSKPLQARFLSLADDEDERVRFQLALSLGEWDEGPSLSNLAKVAMRGADDPWTRLAVASSVPQRAGTLIEELLRMKPGLSSRALLRELATVVGARGDADEVARLLTALHRGVDPQAARWNLVLLAGVAEGMGRRGVQLSAFLAGLPQAKQEAAVHATALLRQAGEVAIDSKSEPEDRHTAVALLAHAAWADAEKPLTRLLGAEVSQEMRLAAVKALAAQPRPEVAAMLLEGWHTYTPAVRREVCEALLRQPDRTLALLREVEAGRVKPTDLDPQRSRQLLNHAQAAIRDKARKLLEHSLPADRKLVLQKYQPALKLKGDPARGQEVFRKNCATCHRVAGIGIDVGPDISDTRTKSPEQLLLDVLDPNAAIDNNYINYTITTKSGKVLTGIIAVETATSVTLKRAEGQSDVVLRQDIEEVVSSGQSLMPEGLEKMLSLEEMADLIGFLKNWRYLDGRVPLGQPGR
jgi:putative membrane-bound dehydrogenase-like protein